MYLLKVWWLHLYLLPIQHLEFVTSLSLSLSPQTQKGSKHVKPNLQKEL